MQNVQVLAQTMDLVVFPALACAHCEPHPRRRPRCDRRLSLLRGSPAVFWEAKARLGELGHGPPSAYAPSARPECMGPELKRRPAWRARLRARPRARCGYAGRWDSGQPTRPNILPPDGRQRRAAVDDRAVR